MASVTFKVVLLGEGCVGKTSLVLRYVENKFNDAHQSTIQASFLTKKLIVNSTQISLAIWDTAGQERFHALGPIYYRDSNGAVLVYDVTDSDSLVKVKTWVKELRKMLGMNVFLAIVGNKIDLLPQKEQSAPHTNPIIAEAIKYSDSASAKHFCTSAKVNKGIDEMFLDLTRRMLEHHRQKEEQNRVVNAPASSRGTLRVEPDNPDTNGTQSSRSCC